jgi:hypothetical protein
VTVGEKRPAWRRDQRGDAGRGLRDRKPKAWPAQIALNRCGRLSGLQRGLRRTTVFRWAPERGDSFSVQKAAYRWTGDPFRRIIQLNYTPLWAPDWLSSALEPSAAATGLPFSVGRAAARRATSSWVRRHQVHRLPRKMVRLQSTLSARFLLTNSEI